MRGFVLIDKDGNAYNLTTKDSAFFYGVSGLGYEKETTFQRVKNRFALIKKEFVQQTLQGTVRFWQDNAEQKYFDFAQFCQNSPLRLVYNPVEMDVIQNDYNHMDGTTLHLASYYLTGNNYFRDGYVTKIEKGDGTGDELTVTIDFTATTSWYKKISTYNYGNYGSGGKKYDYEYDYEYIETANNVLSVTSDSRQTSPTKIFIIGPALNPAWSYYLNGNLKQTGKVNITVPSGYRLIIDATTIPYSIKEYDANGDLVGDMYQSSDFSTDRFISFSYGKNTLSFIDDNGAILGVGVEAQIEYATV